MQEILNQPLSIAFYRITHINIQINYCHSFKIFHLVAAANADRATVNDVAMRTIKVVHQELPDMGCFSHAYIRVCMWGGGMNE